jgi:5-formyltetrahydrofolate cyclo-ligase
MGVSARKRELRAEMRDRRRARPADEEDARRAAEHLAELDEFAAAGQIAIYASLPDELSTGPLFRLATAAGKRVALPRALPEGVLEFAWVERFEDLRPGRYGVAEPPRGCGAASLAEMDLVVVPGVAFDREGGRLGRGGGYYDRALSRVGERRPFVVGFASSVQIVEAVPREAFDQRVDAVVTEHAVLRRNGGGAQSRE